MGVIDWVLPFLPCEYNSLFFFAYVKLIMLFLFGVSPYNKADRNEARKSCRQ